MQVILIRHGMTAGNALRRYIGRTDEPLSPEGIEQAKGIGPDVSIERVYVTPLRRTGQTAAILFPGAAQTVVEELREMDFGDFENRSADEMENDPAYRGWVDGFCLAPCPNGESRDEFSRRVCRAFARIVSGGEEKCVFLVHGGTIMSIMERFARPERDYYAWGVKNCRGYVCRLEPDRDGLPVLTDIRNWEPGK